MTGIVQSLAENLGETFAIDEVNTFAADKIGQKSPYGLPTPPGLSKHDADVLRRCRRRAHQLDHNAVLCYCCRCFFGLNTAICIIPIIGPIWANSLSGRVVRMAEEADIPATLTAQMTANITFDLLVRYLSNAFLTVDIPSTLHRRLIRSAKFPFPTRADL
jgi:hypothetical protein